MATTNADPHEHGEEHVNQPTVKFNFSQSSSSGTSKKTNMHRHTNSVNIFGERAKNKMMVPEGAQVHTCKVVAFKM